MSNAADKVMLDLDDGTLAASLYGAESTVVAEGVDALEILDEPVRTARASGDMVVVTFDLAVRVDVEDRAGRTVAVLGEERDPDK